MSSDFISQDELRKLSREELSDDYILHFICTHFETSTYQAMRSALWHFTGQAHENHVEMYADNMLSMGRLPRGWREYFIDVLCGDALYYTNEDCTEAVFKA